jgi:hydroxypyruvate isomerase
MIRFSANLGFLWRDRPFLERIAAARSAGFTTVEFHDEAQREDPAAVVAALEGLPVAGLNARMGDTAGCAALAGRREEAQADIAAAIATARAVGARAVHVLSGRTEDPAGGDRLASRLREAADAAPELVFLIEPLSPQASPGYFLSTVEQAAEVLERVDRPNARILFDCFHVQRASGDVFDRFRRHLPLIGHVQIAGAPGRNEPDRGELDYRWLLPAMQDAGYEGPFGAEYVPLGTVEEGLGWRDAFRWG